MVKEPTMKNEELGNHIKKLVENYKIREGIVTPANEQQVGGAHYAVKAIQPWDYIIANDLGYLEGNIVKYVSRWKDKGGIEDLKKAQHYLQKLIEVTEKANAN